MKIIIILITTTICGIIWNRLANRYKKGSFFQDLCSTITIAVSVLGILGCALTGISNYAETERVHNALQSQQEYVCKQVEAGLYADAMESIREYNLLVSDGKLKQSNGWYGIFYPNLYDDYELIDFDALVSMIKAEQAN